MVLVHRKSSHLWRSFMKRLRNKLLRKAMENNFLSSPLVSCTIEHGLRTLYRNLKIYGKSSNQLNLFLGKVLKEKGQTFEICQCLPLEVRSLWNVQRKFRWPLG